MTLRQTLREPLLHFSLLGAGLFVLFAWLNRDATQAPDEIVVDDARIASLTPTIVDCGGAPGTLAPRRDVRQVNDTMAAAARLSRRAFGGMSR